MNLPPLDQRFAESLAFYNLLVKEGVYELPGAFHANPSYSQQRNILYAAGLPDDSLNRLEALAERWGVSLREAALSAGAVTADDYVKSAARLHGASVMSAGDIAELEPISPSPEPYRLLEGESPVLSRLPRGDFLLNAEDCDPKTIAEIAAALGPKRGQLKLLSRATMTAAIVKSYGTEIAVRAANGLWLSNQRFSASTGFIRWQIMALAIIAGLFLGGMVFAPREVFLLYIAVMSFMLLIVVTLRAAAAVYAFCRYVSSPWRSSYMLRDDDLPRYTVLVALYEEARILPQLVKALAALEYPAAKLDIKLILEAVDEETVARARMMDLPPQFEILIVPDGAPRTKPRALNYALQFARGELLVVYDAEDRPDPQQLRMAATRFASAPEDVVCLQAQLTIENSYQNWLAKQFTIEYASLFGGILPLLDRARIPIPLGGTSNHFRIGILRKLGAWDAYNVTEDADLGMRIYRAGFRAEVLFSETLEEAACQPGNWLRQRTRWLKGWMQTYQVHMRQPWRLMRELGPIGFFAFQGHFAGVILAALIYPASYVLIAYDATTGRFLSQPHSILDYHLLTITIFNLVAGFAGSFVLALFALKRRDLGALLPQILLIPVYWFFISAAAYRALYQFLTAPHYWEKTEHFGTAPADADDESAGVKPRNTAKRGMLAPIIRSRSGND